VAGQESSGAERHCLTEFDNAGMERYGPDWSGKARRGEAGVERSGAVGRSWSLQARRVWDWKGSVRRGRTGQEGFG
jgi:hypothetical protein